MVKRNRADYSPAAFKFAKRMRIPMTDMVVAKVKATGSYRGRSTYKKTLNAGIKPTLNLKDNGPELKYVNTSANNAAIAVATANITQVLLNPCQQGTTQTARIGDKICVKSIDVHAVLKGTVWSTLGANPGTVIRWWIMVDTQPNGAVFAVGDFLWTSSSYITSHNNPDGSERFRVLRTGYEYVSAIPLNASVIITPTSDDKKIISANVQLNDGVRYKGSVGTIADIQSGAYYFCFCTDQAGDTGPTISYDTMLKYTDE